MVVPFSPYPVTRGFDRLIVELIEGFLVNNEVVLVTMAFSEEEIKILKGFGTDRLQIKTIVAPNKRSLSKKLFLRLKNIIRLVIKGIPLEVSYAAPDEYIDLILRTAEDEKPDRTFISYWHLYDLPRLLSGFKIILITLDLDYLVAPLRLSRMNGLIRKANTSRNLRRLARIEKTAYSNYETILTVTEKDTGILQKEFIGVNKDIRTLPISIDLDQFNRKGRERAKNNILLTGTHLSDFNIDALRYFILDIFPLIRKERPGVTLDIAGKVRPEDKSLLSGENIRFLGFVEDLAESLAKTSLLVIPLRFGGGIRIRMLEAAAVGTPVVSSSKGVEGMGLVNGKEYLEADFPEKMAESVMRLLDDSELADTIGANARKWVENNYSSADYPERLDRLLEDLQGRDSTE